MKSPIPVISSVFGNHRGCGCHCCTDSIRNGSACHSPSELSRIWGISSQLDVNLSADVHPCAQTEVHTVGSVDEFLKLFSGDAFTDLPDTEGRTFRTCGTEAVVVETRFQISGNCFIPAPSRCHGGLGCFPPLLSFPSPKLVVNVEELGSHQSLPCAGGSSPKSDAFLVSQTSFATRWRIRLRKSRSHPLTCIS